MPRRRPTDPAGIAGQLRQRLINYIPGSRLPGRTELARFFGCGESAVAKAILMLVEEGLLERREREGTFVRRAGTGPTIRQVRVLVNHRDFQLFQQTVLLGVDERCQIHRLKMHVDYDPPAELTLDALDKLAGSDPRGVGWVVLTTELPSDVIVRSWLGQGLPFVIVDDFPSISRVNLIVRDIERAVFQATEKLIAVGHRRLALFALPQPLSRVGQQRLAGFKLAHDQYGVPFNPNWVINVLEDHAPTMANVMPILRGSNVPTGIVGVDQYFGCAMIAACDLAGIQVPQDLSVVSAGLHPRLEPAQLSRLSCMDEGSPQRMGRLAVDLLAEHDVRKGPTTVWIEPGYVDRGSVGPPPR